MNDQLPVCPRCRRPPLIEEIAASHTLACGPKGSTLTANPGHVLIRCITDRGRCYVRVEAPDVASASTAWRELGKEHP